MLRFVAVPRGDSRSLGGGAGSFWRLIPVHLILPPKPNSHPSLSHLLPPTATLSSLSPGYLPPSFAFFISFAFLFISLSPSHCSLFLYLLLFPFLFPFSLLLMSHYPSHYSLRSFYFRSSSRIIPLSALSTLLLLLTFPSLRYVYALLLHLSSLLFHYSPALKFFYSYASLLIFSHSLLPLLSSTLQLLLYSPSLCLFTSLLLLPFPFLFSYYILFLKVSLLFLSHSPVPMARRVGGREGGGREGEAGRERGSRWGSRGDRKPAGEAGREWEGRRGEAGIFLLYLLTFLLSIVIVHHSPSLLSSLSSSSSLFHFFSYFLSLAHIPLSPAASLKRSRVSRWVPKQFILIFNKDSRHLSAGASCAWWHIVRPHNSKQSPL